MSSLSSNPKRTEADAATASAQPPTTSSPATTSSEHATSERAHSPPEILIVEDEPLIALDLQRRLKRLGYRVSDSVRTGAEAVASALRRPPSLVLMDIQLAGELDGIEAARQIRAAEHLPILFVTGRGDADTVERAKGAEPHGYVIKPFEERELWSAIELALQRHRTEAKLKQVERWLAMTLRSIGDGVITTDLDGVVTSLNPRASQILGWSEELARGRHVDDVLRLFQDVDGVQTRIESPFQRVLDDGVLMELDADYWALRPDGRRVPIGDSAAPLRDDFGRLTGVVIVFRDRTKQLEAQDQLNRLEGRLRRAQRLEAVGRLAGGVAHDFNNILFAIRGFAELALPEAQPGSSLSRYLELIHTSSQRAANLTQQLLAFGRRQNLRAEPLHLADVVDGMRPLLGQLLGGDHELVTTIPADVGSVWFDRTQLEQVVMNLVVNARDAMPAGGPIGVTARDVELSDPLLSFGEPGDAGPYVLLEVSDRGPGVPAESLQDIFEPFYTTKEPGQGTGLGLSTVYGIVRQSQGFIEVVSPAEGGATFRVYLKRHLGPAVSSAPPPRRATPLRGTGSVLVIEDEDLVRELAEQALEKAGFQVQVAANAVEALAHAQAMGAGLDVIVSDVVLPGTSGPDIVEQIRAERPDLPVVFMSGYPRAVLSGRCALPEGAHYLQKPFSPSTLVEQVSAAIRGEVEEA